MTARMAGAEFGASVLLLALVSVGISLSVVLSLRFLHHPDLTIDGSVATSGGTFAILLVQTGSNLLALAGALGVGFVCGLLTMLLHERFGIGKLLSGILVFTGLYSVNLRLMGGSNVSILQTRSWMDWLDSQEVAWLGQNLAQYQLLKLGALLAVMGLVVALLVLFFRSRPGIVIRGIGDNETAIARLGYPVGRYKYLGMGLANMAAGLGGALMVAHQGFADISMGQGSLVLGLAALIIGERIVGWFRGNLDLVRAMVLAATIGMLIYQALWLFVLKVGLSPTDLKLFTAILVVITLAWGKRPTPFYAGRGF